MKRIFSLVLAFALAITLWVNFAPAAQADLSHLTPCSESAAYKAKSKNFRNTTDDPLSGQKRAERYAEALCGPEGYPHLIVDGRLERAGDFLIPGLLFLYIAGWIGWVGRAYLIAIRERKKIRKCVRLSLMCLSLSIKCYSVSCGLYRLSRNLLLVS